MNVQLVLAAGSRAGTVANIHPGYYMIGRHRPAQIRPKSRSVSRQHCVLHHAEDGFRVFDLKSTSGTRVNDERIETRTWVPLHNGDMLRCGKVAFQIVIDQSSDSVPAPAEASEDSAAPAPMVLEAAWQESDIAAFLEAADDADREQRYEAIRGLRQAAQDDEHYEDTPLESDEATLNDLEPVEVAIGRSEDGSGGPAASPISGSHHRGSPGKLPDAVRRKFGMSQSRSSAGFDADRYKFLAALLVTISVLSFFGYSVYRFQAGPDVRVIQGID